MARVLHLNSFLNYSIELVVRRRVQERPSNWNEVSMDPEPSRWLPLPRQTSGPSGSSARRMPIAPHLHEGAQNTLFVTIESGSRSSLPHATAGLGLGFFLTPLCLRIRKEASPDRLPVDAPSLPLHPDRTPPPRQRNASRPASCVVGI